MSSNSEQGDLRLLFRSYEKYPSMPYEHFVNLFTTLNALICSAKDIDVPLPLPLPLLLIPTWTNTKPATVYAASHQLGVATFDQYAATKTSDVTLYNFCRPLVDNNRG